MRYEGRAQFKAQLQEPEQVQVRMVNGHRNEVRSSGWNEGMSGRRTPTLSGGCCGRQNEGRIRGRSSPYGPVDRVEKVLQSANCRMQIRANVGRGRTWGW